MQERMHSIIRGENSKNAKELCKEMLELNVRVLRTGFSEDWTAKKRNFPNSNAERKNEEETVIRTSGTVLKRYNI